MAQADRSSTSISTPEDSATSISHQKYKLRVTAGTSYDVSTHTLVPVNGPETLHLNTPSMLLSLAVRLKHFTGIPSSSPVTSSYFSHPLHISDQYSISFSFIPKVDIPGNDLLFGNDFDRPIRDRLPPGFGQAFRIVKWFIDPGLEGDPYADKPHLFGPALSSFNMIRIGEKIFPPGSGGKDADTEAWKMPNAESFHETVVEEGAEGSGTEIRSSAAVPIPSDSAGRKKHFLTEANREAFTFEAGRLYQSDFGNPYLDFNDFSLKLPGFSLNVIKYVDEKTHELRYVLKNRSTDEIYAVILFSLLFGEGSGGPQSHAESKEGSTRGSSKDNDKKSGAGEDFGPEKSADEDDVD